VGPIGKRTDSLTYIRSSSGAFELDPKRSTIEKKDIDALYEAVDFDANHDVLRWDLRSLRLVASGPASIEKEWLREFLSKSKPTAECRELEALLKK
jgi:hypothetical protein